VLADCVLCLNARLYNHNHVPEVPNSTFSSQNTGFGHVAARIAAQEATRRNGIWNADDARRKEKRAKEVKRKARKERRDMKMRHAHCVILWGALEERGGSRHVVGEDNGKYPNLTAME
jgi:hypothetical protein